MGIQEDERLDMDADESLLELLAVDLDTHFEQLVFRYERGLSAFMQRHTGNRQLAEDIVQEAFIRAYARLQCYPQYRIRSLKLRPWLYKVTLNVFYGYLRVSRVQEVPLAETETEDNYFLDTVNDDWHDQPDLALEQKEGLDRLGACVASLPLPFREAVNLYYFAELSYRAIAAVLNLPLGTVKSAIHRGTRLLRQALQQQESEVK